MLKLNNNVLILFEIWVFINRLWETLSPSIKKKIIIFDSIE